MCTSPLSCLQVVFYFEYDWVCLTTNVLSMHPTMINNIKLFCSSHFRSSSMWSPRGENQESHYLEDKRKYETLDIIQHVTMYLHTFQAARFFYFMYVCTKTWKNIKKLVQLLTILFFFFLHDAVLIWGQIVETTRSHCLLCVFFLFCHPSCPLWIPPLPDRLVAYLVWQQ